jgi:hypothetical protein
MFRITRSRIGYMTTLGAGILIGVAAVGTASAASSDPTAPAKVVTHHLALAASAFAPDELGNTTKDYSNQWDPSELFNSGDGCFDAGLVLPVNATIKSVTIYFVEGSTSMAFEVNRQNLIKHTFARLVQTKTSTTKGTPSYTSVTKPVPHGLAAVDMGK